MPSPRLQKHGNSGRQTWKKDGAPLAEGVYGMPPTRKRLKFSRYSISILLILVASIGLFSAITIHSGIFYHTTSPTMTYSGYLGISYNGTYHYVVAKPLCNKSFPPCFQKDEVVFYLDKGGEAIRLIFYCGTAVQDYCRSADEVHLVDGTCVHVKGTLLIPSSWPTNQFEPTLQFNGDLYVFQYELAPEGFCS